MFLVRPMITVVPIHRTGLNFHFSYAVDSSVMVPNMQIIFKDGHTSALVLDGQPDMIRHKEVRLLFALLKMNWLRITNICFDYNATYGLTKFLLIPLSCLTLSLIQQFCSRRL